MARVPYTKPALTYSAQLQRLKDRGLGIADDNKALHLLEHLSYYRLSGYWFPMLKMPKSSHTFKPGSTFENAFKIYLFDRDLKRLITNELEKVEIAVRAKMIYIMAMRHGAFWFTNPALFVDPVWHNSTLKILAKEYNRSDEDFIKKFKNDYSDPYPPCWMSLEIASFGTLSNFYSNLNPGFDKRDIAEYFGVDETTFQSWLHSMTYVRNVCAHHSRLWNKKLRIAPQIPLSPKNQFITAVTIPTKKPTPTPKYNNEKMYFFLSVTIYLLNIINPKHKFKNKFYCLVKQYPNIHLPAMGFPIDWEKERLWNWKEVVTEEKWYNRLIRFLKNKF